jgi:hypothetical protein
MEWVNYDTLSPVERARALIAAINEDMRYRPERKWKHINGKNVLCDPKPRSKKTSALAKLVAEDIKQGRLPEETVNGLTKFFKGD